MRTSSQTVTCINSNIGRVVALIKGGQRIIIEAARGGRFECQNKGFELGEVLCYTFDPVTKKITSLVPKAVADAQAVIASIPTLQLAAEESEVPNERNGVGEISNGFEDACPPDIHCGLVGATDGILIEWGAEDNENNFDPDRIGDPDLLEDEGRGPDDIPI